MRAAGLGMLLMPLLNFALRNLVPAEQLSGRPFSSGASGFFDLILGIMLAANFRSALGISQLRVWLGLLLGVPLLGATGGAPAAVIQGLWSLGLLALLTEKPGKPRLLLGTLCMLTTLGLASLGAFFLKVGPGVFAYRGQTTSLPADGILKTRNSRLTMQVTAPGWELFKPEEVKITNPLFDFWLVHPKLDLHVAVLPEALEEPLALDDCRDSVLANLSTATVTSEEDHPLGKLLRIQHAEEGLKFERFILLIVSPTEVYQIHAWCLAEVFPAHEKDFRAILNSIRLHPEQASKR